MHEKVHYDKFYTWYDHRNLDYYYGAMFEIESIVKVRVEINETIVMFDALYIGLDEDGDVGENNFLVRLSNADALRIPWIDTGTFILERWGDREFISERVHKDGYYTWVGIDDLLPSDNKSFPVVSQSLYFSNYKKIKTTFLQGIKL